MRKKSDRYLCDLCDIHGPLDGCDRCERLNLANVKKYYVMRKCGLCEGSGEYNGKECTGCDGAGELTFNDFYIKIMG